MLLSSNNPSLQNLAFLQNLVPDRSLSIGLLLAFTLHALILCCVTWPHYVPIKVKNPILELMLNTSTPGKTTPNAPLTSPNKALVSHKKTTAIFPRKSVAIIATHPDPTTLNHALITTSPLSATENKKTAQENTKIENQSIMEMAKQIAREEGQLLERNHSASKIGILQPDTLKSAQDTLSKAIGSAFEKPKSLLGSAESVQMADGSIMVITSTGTKYCFKPRATFENGGPTENKPIATTCPK